MLTMNKDCMMEGCPAAAKIQHFYHNKFTLENKLTLHFEDDVHHKVGNLKVNKNTLTGPANCKKTTRYQSPVQTFLFKNLACPFSTFIVA